MKFIIQGPEDLPAEKLISLLFPWKIDKGPITPPLWAEHLECLKLAAFLEKVLESRGNLTLKEGWRYLRAQADRGSLDWGGLFLAALMTGRRNLSTKMS